uniref:Uncharacterized protein n=1 Tax=Cupriavidus taiwanensis TaxID=164546 RepID=A0A375H9R2_9BURK|nr:protein of unknown function [Cupriavidus taiwanensis]
MIENFVSRLRHHSLLYVNNK